MKIDYLPQPSQPTEAFCEYLETLPEDQRDHVIELPGARQLSGRVHEPLGEDMNFKSRTLLERAEAVSAKADIQSDVSLGVLRARHEAYGGFPFEVVAEAAYPQVLFEAQAQLGDAIIGNRKLTAFFVPGLEHMGWHDYTRRLNRLAQDVGVCVVTKMRTFDNTEAFERFFPPQAVSVDAYWAEQEGHRAARQYKLGQEKRSSLQELASLSTDTLQDLSLGKLMLRKIRKHAYGPKAEYGDEMAAARLILAKRNDSEGYELLKEYKDSGRNMASIFMDEPLGVYLAHDPERTEYFKQRAAQALADDQKGPYEPLRDIMPLVYSCQSSVGVFLTNYLVEPTPNSYVAARRGVFDYFRLTQDLTEYDINHHDFFAMWQNMTSFLATQNAARRQSDTSEDTIRDALMASDILLDWKRKGVHAEVLGTHILALYEEAGSVITCRDGFTLADKWSRQYMQYRKQYGDLPEISRYVRIFGE